MVRRRARSNFVVSSTSGIPGLMAVPIQNVLLFRSWAGGAQVVSGCCRISGSPEESNRRLVPLKIPLKIPGMHARNVGIQTVGWISPGRLAAKVGFQPVRSPLDAPATTCFLDFNHPKKQYLGMVWLLRSEQCVHTDGVMKDRKQLVRRHIPLSSSLKTGRGDLYLRLSAFGGDDHVVPASAPREPKVVNFTQTFLVYIVFSFVPCHLEHEKYGGWLSRRVDE